MSGLGLHWTDREVRLGSETDAPFQFRFLDEDVVLIFPEQPLEIDVIRRLAQDTAPGFPTL